MSSPAAPKRITNRYELRRVLGRGGVGAVWLAIDTVLDREVAIKAIPLPQHLPEAEQAAVRDRVFREARAAARLRHRGAITIYDVVADDDTAYLVMELLRAPTLAQLVREHGPLDPRRAARLGLQILSALEAAHAAGIVHRDVKPGNVIVRSGDVVALADFGIASLVDEPGTTASGLMLGSPSYIAPEQASGQESGPAVDLWGLGATLYFAVEGRPPFDSGAGSLATIHAVVTAEPAPPEHAGPLTPVILSLLSKDPAMRLRGARLRQRLAEIAIPSPPVPPGTIPPRRSRTPALLAGAATLVILGSAVALVAIAPDPAAAPAPAAVTADPDASAASEPDGEAADAATASEASTTATPEPSPTPAAAVEVPTDWPVHVDSAGDYRLAHPPSWQVEQVSATTTVFRDPNSPTSLLLEWTPSVSDVPLRELYAELSATFAESREGYEELRVISTSFRGFDAALWEYRVQEDGTELHAAQLAFLVEDRRYELRFETPAENWPESQDLFPVFQAAFDITRERTA